MDLLMELDWLNVPEKQLTKPIAPANDRIWQKFQVENISDANQDFNSLFFRCSVPSSNSLIKSFDVVLPLRFRFRDRAGNPVDRDDIAIAPDQRYFGDGEK